VIAYLQNKDVTVDVPDDMSDKELSDLNQHFAPPAEDGTTAPTLAPPAAAPSESGPQAESKAAPAAAKPSWLPNFYESYIKPIMGSGAGGVLGLPQQLENVAPGTLSKAAELTGEAVNAIPATAGPAALPGELSSTPETRAFTGKAVDAATFGLTKPIIDPLVGNEYAEHPVWSTAGQLTGDLGSLLATGGVLKLAGLGAEAAEIGAKGAEYLASAPRFLPRAIMTGATFGTKTFVEKTIKAFQDGNVDPAEFGKDVLFQSAGGAAFGAIGGIAKVPVAVASAAGVMFTMSKMEGASNADAGLSAAVGAAFEMVGGAGRSEELNREALSTIAESISNYAKKMNPGIAPEVADNIGEGIVRQQAERFGGVDAMVKGETGKEDTLQVLEGINQKIRQGKVRPPTAETSPAELGMDETASGGKSPVSPAPTETAPVASAEPSPARDIVAPSSEAPASTESSLQAQPGTGPAHAEGSNTVFPPTPVTSSPSIAEHPDFIQMTNDATAVTKHYAEQRGVEPTREFATGLWKEMHDAMGEILHAPAEQRMAVRNDVIAKYPDIEREFLTLRDKLWSDATDNFFGVSVAGKYGHLRPKLGIEAEDNVLRGTPKKIESPTENISSTPENQSSKPIKVDESGLPIRKPGSVVSRVTLPNGQSAKITHQMVLDEASTLHQDALDKRGSAGALEKFVMENGKIRNFKADETGNVPEAEEMKSVPLRFKGGTLSADEMAQMAYDRGLLPEPSADLLRGELQAIHIRGASPKLADYYDEAQRNLEHLFGAGDENVPERAQGEELPEPEWVNEGVEEMKARKEEARRAAQEILSKNKLSDQAVVNVVDQIVADDEAFTAGYGREFDEDHDVIHGETRMIKDPNERMQAVINLANGASAKTGYHEAFHAVTNLLLDDTEKKTILGEFDDFEQAADAFAEFQSQEKPKAQGIVAKIFDKVKRFLDRIAQYFKSNKYETSDDIFNAISEGKMGDRQSRASQHLTQYQAAYHGTPYKFNKFSTEKIGSGEGAQVYGWGLYFSSKKEVAEHYRDQLSPPSDIPAGVRLALDRIGILKMRNETPEKAIQGLRADKNWKETWDSVSNPLSKKDAKTIDDFLAKQPSKGHVYHVDIPDDNEYLDWDKPLSKQSDKVKKALEQTVHLDRFLAGANNSMKNTGGEFYKWIAGEPDVLDEDQKEAAQNLSQSLADAGIPGIKYLDQLSRASDKTGTSNYVIFDDKHVKVLSQYSAGAKGEPPAENPADRYNKLKEEARKAAQEILTKNKLDDQAVVNVVDHILADDEAFTAGYGREFDEDHDVIHGETRMVKDPNDRMQAVINLANGATAKTGYHEAFHAVTNLLLDDAEKKTILGEFDDFEKAADAFADYQSQETPKAQGVIAKIFDKVKKFLAKIRDYFKSNKYETADDIFKAIDEGKMGERASRASQSIVQYQAAFHGSPHVFDKFSTARIGTGEGNQAYGWGLYFAGKKEVAEYYRNRLFSAKTTVPVSVRNALGFLGWHLDNSADAEQAIRDIAKSKDWKSEFWAGNRFPKSEQADIAAKEVENYIAAVKNKGRMYEVDIPDDKDLLDHDKILADQKDVLKNVGKFKGDKFIATIENPKNPEQKFTEEFDPYSEQGDTLYNIVADRMADHGWVDRKNSDEMASRFLASKGIPGLKYLDEQSRREGKGTSNYVIFDDKHVKVLSQYSAGAKGEPPAENPADRYNKLKEEAKAQGMKPHEAAKWAKEQILKDKTEPESFPEVKQETIPTINDVKENLKDMRDEIRNLVAPATSTPRAGEILRENLGKMARSFDQAETALKSAMDMFDKRTPKQNTDFIDKMEHGESQSNEGLDQIATELRKLFDKKRAQVQELGTGKLQSFIENYFPHIWDQSERTVSKATMKAAKRPLEGSKSFLKKRTIEFFKDGIKLGLTPISYNPVELTLLKIREMDKYLAAHQTLNAMKQEGLAKFVRVGGDVPDGWQKVDDKISTVMQKTDDGGMVIRGHYYMQEDAARLINNYLKPGLQKFALFRAYRYAGNMLNQFQLGFSAFHLGFTSMDSIVSKVALSLNQLALGHPMRAAQDFISAPIAPIQNMLRGDKVMKAWMKGGDATGFSEVMANAMEAAGGRARMDQFYATAAWKQMTKYFAMGAPIRGILHLPLALTEVSSKPILEWIVPRQKLGIFADIMRMEMQNNPNLSHEEMRSIAQRAWDSVDNRMGQLVYDNLFWNKTFKDLLMGSVRSVGWNLGTIRELGGGAIDIARIPKDKELSYRAAYFFALPIVVGIASAVYQYLRTGQGPQDLKDYFYPRNGGLDQNGMPNRISLPSYMKDLYHYSQAPLQTVLNKLNPVLAMLQQMYQNKDFYGVKIRNEDDPVVRQVASEVAYIVKQMEPFGLRNMQRNVQTGNKSLADIVEPWIGITPAPYDINQTKAEKVAHRINAEKAAIGGRTQAQADHAVLMRQLSNGLVAKTPTAESDMMTAFKNGLISTNDMTNLIRESRMTPLQRLTSRMSAEELQRVYDVATPEEKAQIETSLRIKDIRHKSHYVPQANAKP